MTTQIKAVYMMITGPHQTVEERLHALSMHGFEFLNNTNRAFPIHLGRIKKQKRPEDIIFAESFQLIPSLDKSKEDIVGSFKQWIHGQGASTPDSIWDTHCFLTKLSAPEYSTSEYYYLVYIDYDVDEGDIKPFATFLSEYVLAVERRDGNTLNRLLQYMVRCWECKKLVDPVLTAQQESGFLRCPFCGQSWTGSAKDLKLADTARC